ncbi:MAG: hypothetical protein ACRCXK_08475 [Wohlfahrtiimonas sp.]
MSFGLIIEDGILKGFKMPEHDVHKKKFAERELKQKLTKEQLRYADHALEFRARWLHESVGYGDSSCNIKEGDRMPAGSNIPIGCEIPEVVAKAIHALDEMKKINKTHKQYVFLLNEVYLARKDNERIADVIKEKGYSLQQYRNARNRFAYFLANY